MKLKPSDINNFLKNPDKAFQAALVYGPDSGMVHERVMMIIEGVIGKNADPFNKVEISGDQLKSDPAMLLDELCAYSLMGGKRIVVVRDPPEKSEATLKAALEAGKNTAFLVIEGSELSSKSAIRAFFEKENFLASLACYQEEGRALEGVIREILGGYGMQAAPDALAYLAANLGNDRAVTRSELEKIALYMGEQKQVTLNIAMQLTGDNAQDTVEDFCHAVALGKVTEADHLLQSLLNEGIQVVGLLRMLLKYFQRLDLVYSHIKAGQSPNQAIATLRPPVFYKSVPVLERIVALKQPNRIARIMNQLLVAEKDAKSSVLPPALQMGRLIQELV